MKVLSFGTVGRYAEYLGRLEQSLKEHGVPYLVEVIGPRKKFQAAMEKPEFILKHLTEPVLWLDADSFVTGPIELPEGEWDVGFLPHWRTGSTVVCCAVAFRPTDAARRFLAHWAELCDVHAEKITGTEHERMIMTQEKIPVSELDLSECLRGRVIFNYRIRKEHAL